MPKIKGSGMLIVKKLIIDKGSEVEKQLIGKLDPASLKVWESDTLAISWVETELAEPGTLLYEAACVLFPGDPQKALWEIGRIMAREGLPKFYQIFIRIPTPQFVFKRVAQLWRSFYKDGEASIEALEKNQATFYLREFPAYTANMRMYMNGYFFGMADILKLKNIQVERDDSNPQEWKWKLKWQ